ncbi:hypothetical protein Tco_0952022 [Tanacetum coccineum]|uniref:Uncharacterized protein n=1 Tax=Tanacetum coccineum TaxID=301880 RepID=A0ABQ5DY64_9ASTR
MTSPEHISPLPAISPFICTDSSDRAPLQDPYVATVARWRSRVTARPSSSHEFPIAPVIAPPGIRRRSATLIRPGEAIPFGRPYRTHFNGPRKFSSSLCTDSSKAPESSDGPPSQDPFVATVARWRSRVTTHPSSSSEYPITPVTAPPRIRRRSSSDSSPVHSSGLDAPDQAHSESSTIDVPPPRRAPQRSEAFRHWCVAPLSTLYPPTTSESSSGESSERPLHPSSPSTGPSRKRCRSLVDYVPSSTPVMGSLAPTRADLLPLQTEVDIELGIGDGDDVRDHVEIDPRDVRDDTEENEADTSVGDTVEVGIDPMSAPMVEEEILEPVGEDSSDLSGTRDGIVRSFEDMPIDLDDAVRDFYHHMSEFRIDRIVRIETVQRRLEVDQLIARGQRVSMIKRIESLRLENFKVRAMLDIKRDRVNILSLS